MHKDYKHKPELSSNRNDLLESFSKALKLAIHNYWEGKSISAALFAKEFNKYCEESHEVSREQVRRWVRGDAFPEPLHFAILHQWLNLDVNIIFETIPTVERFVANVNSKNWKIKKSSNFELLQFLKDMEDKSDEDIIELIKALKTILFSRL